MKNNKIKKCILFVWNNIFIEIKALFIRYKTKLKIMSLEKTICYIKNNECSISRYGDGEFDIMLRRGEPGFQKSSHEISEKLLEVFVNPPEKLLICIPQALTNTKRYRSEAKKYWNWWAIQKQEDIIKLIKQKTKRDYIFGDSYVSRPYSGYKSRKIAKNIFKQLKEIWNNKDLLIVEGEFTRLGVGNNLFDNANSIKRILAPSVNAFDCYELIYDTVVSNWKGELVILALGPTATILASDLSKFNIQALDLGHLDVQYQWYLNGKAFVPIEGKYTNETDNNKNFSKCNDSDYGCTIIANITKK